MKTAAKNNRMAVTVEKETKKALLVAADGRRGWIQKRWMSADGTVSETTFTKAYESYEARQAAYKEAADFKSGYHEIEIERETEKAVAVKVCFDAYNVERDVVRLAWIPKSLLRDGKAPGWVLLDRANKIEEELKRYGGVACESIGGISACR